MVGGQSPHPRPSLPSCGVAVGAEDVEREGLGAGADVLGHEPGRVQHERLRPAGLGLVSEHDRYEGIDPLRDRVSAPGSFKKLTICRDAGTKRCALVGGSGAHRDEGRGDFADWEVVAAPGHRAAMGRDLGVAGVAGACVGRVAGNLGHEAVELIAVGAAEALPRWGAVAAVLDDLAALMAGAWARG